MKKRCWDCKYFSENVRRHVRWKFIQEADLYLIKKACEHPKFYHTKMVDTGTPIKERVDEIAIYGDCHEINKDLNCKYFEPYIIWRKWLVMVTLSILIGGSIFYLLSI